MKKKFGIGILMLVVCLLLTGCGKVNKTAHCTMSSNQSMFTTKQDVSVTIENNKFVNAKLSIEMVLSDSYLKTVDPKTFAASMETQMKGQYKDCKIQATATGAIVTINLDKAEMAKLAGVTESQLDRFNQKEYNSMIASFEKSGYTCQK